MPAFWHLLCNKRGSMLCPCATKVCPAYFMFYLQATLPIRHGSQNLTCMRLSGALRMAKISSSAPTMRNLEHAC